MESEMRISFSITLLTILLFQNLIFSQNTQLHKGIFVEVKSAFRDSMSKAVDDFRNLPKKSKLHFKIDVENMDLPNSTKDFTSYWHNEWDSKQNW